MLVQSVSTLVLTQLLLHYLMFPKVFSFVSILYKFATTFALIVLSFLLLLKAFQVWLRQAAPNQVNR